MDETDLNEWFTALMQSADDSADALQRAYQALRDTNDSRGVPLLNRVTLHRYQCTRGCQIATVFRAGQTTLCAVRDYKYSRGLNAAQSVQSAREKNTLDGDRHWPSHVFDVDSIAEWGEDTGMSITCRHFRGTLSGARVLRDVADASPGKPGRPTRLEHA